MPRSARILLAAMAVTVLCFISQTSIGMMATNFSIPTEQLKTCLRNVMYEILPNLISTIRQDLEVNALRPLLLDKGNHFAKGLDPNFFCGKRIAMMGDSTLYYPTKWLHPLVTKFENETHYPKYENMTLTNAASLVQQRGVSLEWGPLLSAVKPPPRPIITDDGTWIEWMGAAGPRLDYKYVSYVEEMFYKAENMKPQIIVANFAFHWLHICPDLNCPSSTSSGGVIIQYWIYYRKKWLQRLYDMAIRVDASLLLFKTSNFVCDEKRTGQWAKGVMMYLSSDGDKHEQCYNSNKRFMSSYNISELWLRDYCKYGHFTEFGAQFLNAQVKGFVREKMFEKRNHSKLVVGLFGDHDIQDCNSTQDGIHHKHEMTLARLRLLANTIELYSGCVSD